MTSITICTPWFSHHELLADYVAAVAVATEDDKVIILDNGDAPAMPSSFHVEAMGSNVGFTRACNRGLELAETPAILWLNNDIRMVSDDWLERLRHGLEPDHLVGANLRYDRHGDVDGQNVPYLDGWCLAGMRDDLLELGGFDETLEEPAYYSDNAICLEARSAGMTLREVPVGLHHKRSQTEHPNRAAATAANRVRYQQRARELLTPLVT